MSGRGFRHTALRAWQRATGGNSLEVCLLAGATLSVVAVIVATVSAGLAETNREDLSFRGATQETAALIENRGPTGVATYRRGALEVAGSRVAVDSLEVSGDSLLFGSLAKGGFLRDQIEAFNDYQARRAVAGWATRGGETASAASPSLFHLARTDSGYHYLSSELNGFALLVPSPFAERQWSTVRTADWRSGAALVGLVEEARLFAGDSTLSPPSRPSGTPCRVQGKGAASRLLYCRSAAGADVGEAFDLGFDLRRDSSFVDGAALLLARQTPLWWNGARGTPSTVRAGDLLYTAPAGPLVLSDVQSGVLAGPQWLNGRATFALARTGTLQLFAQAGRSVGGQSAGPLTLSLDAGLSDALDVRVEDFMARNARYLDAVSIVVADLVSGEVKAISESGARAGTPLRAFEPVLLGSMVKPIIAAALLSQDPTLGDLVVEWGGPEVGRVAGVDLRVPFRNPLNGCDTRIDFESFLRCSSNQYAVELLVRSIQRSAGTTDVAPKGVVPNGLLEHTALTNGLLSLFDDADVVSVRTPGRSDRLWGPSPTSIAAGARVPGDRTLHPWTSRPWFIYPESPGTAVDWLARFAFGGWENRWTLLGAAEAYARIATGREVQLTVQRRPTNAEPFRTMDAPATAAFRRVRLGLETVGESGTARGLNTVVRGVAPASDSLRVLAKTGTLSEITSRRVDDDVFIKSLAMAMGRPVAARAGSELGCGLVAIAYFEFRQDWRQAVRVSEGAALPDLHREFATNELAPALKEAWARMGVCPARAAPPPAGAVP